MSKHTPGPWQVSGIRQKLGSEDCLRVGPDSFYIAFLPIGNDQAGAIRDARLIAAAPAMLEALRTLVDRNLIYLDNSVMGDQITAEQVTFARAAIKAATGETE